MATHIHLHIRTKDEEKKLLVRSPEGQFYVPESQKSLVGKFNATGVAADLADAEYDKKLKELINKSKASGESVDIASLKKKYPELKRLEDKHEKLEADYYKLFDNLTAFKIK